MATRLYLPSDTIVPPFTPIVAPGWDDVSIRVDTTTSTTKRSSAMTTVAFTDANAQNKDVLFMTFTSPELTAGQAITESQAIKAQIRGLQVALTNNMFTAWHFSIQNSSGPTLTKALLAITRDDVELATSLINRQFSATSLTGAYTTVAGDYIVVVIGTAGDPDVGSDHDSSLRVGDAAASDLPEDDTDTTDLNPWIELADTLTFAPLSTVGARAQLLSSGGMVGTVNV